MRSTVFPDTIKVRADPDLRADLVRAAREDRTTVAELVRRELRSALAGRPTRPPEDDDPGPFSGAPGLRVAA